MKYSKDTILEMSFQQWTETMAMELNGKGVKADGLRGEKIPFEGKNPKVFILGELGSQSRDEINYLKEIGLLNNGRCPMCGNQIIGEPGRFTSGYDSQSHFQICQDCVGSRGRGKVSLLDQIYIQGGCFTTILLTPIVLLVHKIKGKKS